MAMCDTCLYRIPYATLIATIMCFLGVAVFCGSMYSGATLAFWMFYQVFEIRLNWVEAVRMAFITIGACTGAVGFMIFTARCPAMGKTWRSLVEGKIICEVFLAITYILQITWILMFCFLVIITSTFTIFRYMCDHPKVQNRIPCIDFTQFYWFYSDQHKQEHMKVCSDQEVKRFCKGYVEKAEVLFVLATSSCLLIILSLVHYIIYLSVNYANIIDYGKLKKLQNLRFLIDWTRSY